MMVRGEQREAIGAPGTAEARAVGSLLIVGAGLVALSLSLPHPSGVDTPALLTIAAPNFV